MANALVWYRNDLRTIDHEPFLRASTADRCFAVHCIDPRQFETTELGFERTGPFRARFLIESLTDLRSRLRSLGGELIVRVGRPETVLQHLLPSLAIDAVHFHHEPGTEEADTAESVQQLCDQQGIATHVAYGDTLIHPDELPFEISDTPELFTDFRKEIEKQCEARSPLDEPIRIHGVLPEEVNAGDIPTLESLGLSTPPLGDRCLNQFTGGQNAAQQRMEEYIWNEDRLRVYKETRNGMLHPNDSSKFSPWLAQGCLSPRMIADHVRRYEEERVKNKSTYWMIFELLWRDYFRWISRKHGATLFRAGGLRGVNVDWKSDRELFRRWQDGTTGYPLVDANMRELRTTGYMSNRGRQNVASFLTKNLGIDWRWGARWFESQLVDYDVASNYGNWNYAAGVGNDARRFRFFNITKQSRDYDSQGEYAKHWLPELRDLDVTEIHEPWKISPERQQEVGVTLGKEYPHPIVDLFDSAKENETIYMRAKAASH